MTKHTPAAPLPWSIEDSELGVCVRDARNRPGDLLWNSRRASRRADGQYIAHAANAYPKLVEALRAVLAKDGHGLRTTGELPARALLRELGEE